MEAIGNEGEALVWCSMQGWNIRQELCKEDIGEAGRKYTILWHGKGITVVVIN